MHKDPQPAAAASGTHVGKPLERLEDAALLCGRGAYADDLGVKPGTSHAAVLRSPHAHAELVLVDVATALAMPGVRAVLTAEDVQRWSQKNGAIASATVGIDLLGGVNVTIASAPAGQGHMTVCAQVVADVFGLDPSQIVVNVEFDTAKDAVLEVAREMTADAEAQHA